MKNSRLDRSRYLDLQRRVLKRDGWRCQLCGGRRQLEVHHVQFRARGGADLADNLMALCQTCHELIHLCN